MKLLRGAWLDSARALRAGSLYMQRGSSLMAIVILATASERVLLLRRVPVQPYSPHPSSRQCRAEHVRTVVRQTRTVLRDSKSQEDSVYSWLARRWAHAPGRRFRRFSRPTVTLQVEFVWIPTVYICDYDGWTSDADGQHDRQTHCFAQADE